MWYKITGNNWLKFCVGQTREDFCTLFRELTKIVTNSNPSSNFSVHIQDIPHPFTNLTNALYFSSIIKKSKNVIKLINMNYIKPTQRSLYSSLLPKLVFKTILKPTHDFFLNNNNTSSPPFHLHKLYNNCLCRASPKEK